MRVFLSDAGPAEEFSKILDQACRSAGIDPDERPKHTSATISRTAAARLRQLVDDELATRGAMLATSLESYLEHGREPHKPRAARPADPKAVAEELRISAQMSIADLKRLRREFALANHPDRSGADQRDNATRRMMIANMLIDREVKRRNTKRLPFAQ